MRLSEEGNGVRRPRLVPVLAAWAGFLAVIAFCYWALALFWHLAHRKQLTSAEIVSSRQVCDGGPALPVGVAPSPERCDWLFHWWEGPAMFTIVVAAVAVAAAVARHTRGSHDRVGPT